MKHDPKSLLSGITSAFNEGNVELAVTFRDPLHQMIKARCFRGAAELEAKARCAQAYLVTADRQEASRCLSPFVSFAKSGQRFRLNLTKIKALQDSPTSYEAGLVISQVANLLYRSFQFPKGAELAGTADDLLQKRSDPEAILAIAENQIWWARLQWRVGELTAAKATLSRMLYQLERGQTEPHKVNGGRDLVWALAHDLWATFDWRQGHLDDARRRIHMALDRLRNEVVKDKIRLAHALYIAGRIEAADARPYTSPLRYYEQAKKILEDHKHSCVARPVVNAAQYCIKIKQRERAKKYLEEVRNLLDVIPSESERTYVTCDVLLAELWILEQSAYSGTSGWDAVLEKADELVETNTKLVRASATPNRLALEGALHRGLSKIHIHKSEKQVREGVKLARAVLEDAQKGGARKIEIAARFTIAEGVRGTDKGGALEQWREGTDLLSTINGGYLEEWQRRLGRELRAPLIVVIDPNKTFGEGKKALERAYYSNLWEIYRDHERCWKAAGVSKATWFTKKNAYNIGGAKDRGTAA